MKDELDRLDQQLTLHAKGAAQQERDPRLGWPSVTRILKAAGLSSWQDVTLDMVRRGTERGIPENTLRYILQGVEPAVLDAKAELGQNVHLAVQDLETGLAERWWRGENFAGYVEAYLKFKEETNYTAQACEEQLFNDTYKYKGCLDSRGKMGQFDVVIDIKTTATMPSDIQYQLAAYELCLAPNPKRLRFGVQLRRDATYQLHEYRDRRDKDIFLAALSVASVKGIL